MNLEKAQDLGGELAALAMEPEMHSVVTAKPNVWDIVYPGTVPEIRYSRMLGWLLDPQGSHGLGNYFAKFFFALSGYTGEVSDDLIVEVEVDNIDFLVADPQHQVIVVVENKTGTKEHNHGTTDISQLEKYETVVAAGEYRDFDPSLIFLTKDGEEASVAGWASLSYGELLEPLESAFLKADENGDLHAARTIQDFLYSIKRWVETPDIEKVHSLFFQPANAADGSGDNVRFGSEELNVRFARELAVVAVAMNLVDKTVEKEDAGEFYDRVVKEAERMPGQEAQRFREDVQSAFCEASEFDASELKNLLQYVWSNKPRQHKQNHDDNVQVQLIMRMLFNKLAGYEHFDVDAPETFGKEKKEDRRAKVGLQPSSSIQFCEMTMAGGKGQSITLIPAGVWPDPGFKPRFYISGDSNGNIPNDGFSLFDAAKKQPKKDGSPGTKPLGLFRVPGGAWFNVKEWDPEDLTEALFAEIGAKLETHRAEIEVALKAAQGLQSA